MDIDKIRAETPSCMERIHFNNAGSSLMSLSVVDAIKSYSDLEFEKGGYYAQEKNHETINDIYQSIAKLLNCDSSEVALCDSSTTAWQKAMLSLNFVEGDEVLTTYSEYSSNYMFLLKLKEDKNIKIIFINEDENNNLDLTDLELKISKKTKLISVTHMPTGNGVVHPIEKIGEITSKHNIFYIVDACQSAGQYPLDVKKIQCDFLTVSGRKFLRGPRGTGFLYVSLKKMKELSPAFVDLRSADWVSAEAYKLRNTALAFETWEKNFSIYLGLGVAVDKVNSLGSTNIWKRVQKISSYLRQELKKINGLTVHDIADHLSGIVTFSLENESEPDVLIDFLEKKNVRIGATKKEFTQLEFRERSIDFVFRASVHYYNTEHEVDRFIKSITSYIKP